MRDSNETYIGKMTVISPSCWKVARIDRGLTIVTTGDQQFDIAFHVKGTYQLWGADTRTFTAEQRDLVDAHVERIRKAIA